MILEVIRRPNSVLPTKIEKKVGQKLVGLRFTTVELNSDDLDAIFTDEGIAWARKHLLPQMKSK